MPERSECPTSQRLLRFAVGALDDAGTEQLGRHLEQCARCTEALDKLRATDPLLEALRSPSPAERPLLEPALQNLLDELKGRPGIVTAVPNTDEGFDSGTFAAPDLLFLDPPQAPGELGRLAHFRVLEILGQGGMGLVFRAQDEQLHRQVALKVVRPEIARQPLAAQRFLREARLAASLKSDHIVTIHHVGKANGIPFLAMQLLEGESVEHWLLRHGRVAIADALRVGREIAQGLADAHAQGIIHRDIKPANIWLEAPQGRVKILDFGLARSFADGTRLTHSGTLVGTPAYMAPEQARGQAPEVRCDLFSLGCVLYQLTTGQLPFPGKDTMSVLLALATTTPRPPHDLDARVPLVLSTLIMRLLAKDTTERPASARQVVEALQAIEQGLSPVPEDSAFLADSLMGGPASPTDTTLAEPLLLPNRPAVPDYRSTRPGLRRRLLMPMGAGLLVLLAVLLFVQPWWGQQRTPDRPLANDAEAAWRTTVAALPPEGQVQAVTERLRSLNPGFAGDLKPTFREGVVTGLTMSSAGIADLTPLQALPRLQQLICSGKDSDERTLVDLRPLRGLPLTYLAIGYTGVSDLSPLEGMPLEVLNADGSPVRDLTPVRGLPLKELYLWAAPLSDLTPLRGMSLESLSIAYTAVEDLTPLAEMPLISLWISGTRVRDLKPLRGMPLRKLIANQTRVTDLKPLETLTLEILACDFSPARDAKILRAIPTLREINGLPVDEFWKMMRPAGDP